MSDSNARYHLAPRESEDSDRDISPQKQLLPSTNVRPSPRESGPWTVVINPIIGIRILSTICALTSFITLVIGGGEEFIAADIFLMMLIISNTLVMINVTLTNLDLMKVTVELRRQARSFALGGDIKPRFSTFLDVGLSLCLMICLVVGVSVKSSRHRYWDDGVWEVGHGFGWTCLGLQLLLAIPTLANKRLTLTTKLKDLKPVYTPDIKTPASSMGMSADVDRVSSERRVRRRDEPSLVGDDLV
ncbi:hypothetical protein LSUE1_G001953 [Lachnellula suecica]|uniref:Uncharacterized protein n=1 Tax=Lachnellula suecica TaxID=602035 RepID=A0A8T9CCE2_9HELO|nr:hypothetical protein LSUE1_G001953 [Lachnellula suecica]